MQDRPNTEREGVSEPEWTAGSLRDRTPGEPTASAAGRGRGEDDPGRQVAEETRHQAAQLGREVRDQARELGREIEDTAFSRAEQGRHRVAEGLHAVSQALRSGASQLRDQDEQVGRDLVERLAEPVDRISDYLERHETRELAADLENFARRNQGLFLGGAFAAGLLGARFLKASARADDYYQDDRRPPVQARDLGDDVYTRRLPSHQAPPTGEPPAPGSIGDSTRHGL